MFSRNTKHEKVPYQVETAGGKFRKKAKRFLTSRNGKRITGICVLLAAAITGFSIWNQDAYMRKGLELCKKGEYSAAVVEFKNAVAEDNLDPEGYVNQGMALIGCREYREAEKQFQLALNLDHENQKAFRGLGITAFLEGRYEEAVIYFDLAIQYCDLRIDETELDCLRYRVQAETALGDYEAAEQTYSALLVLDEDSASLRSSRGRIYCLLNRKEEALADFDEAIAKEGNGYELYWHIYDSLEQVGWTEEACGYLQYLQEPGRIDESRYSSEENKKYRAMACCVSGDYEEAIEMLSDERLAEDEQALFYLAQAYERSGQKNHAQVIYLQQINKADADAQDYNRLALFCIRCGNGEAAVDYLKQGIELFDQTAAELLHYNMVTAYESYGAYEDALDALKVYESLYSDHAEAVAHEKLFLNSRIW